MNYQKIYNDLINRAKIRTLEGYSESHHIIPRCMGGSDNSDNLVELSPEEHYVAHQLLIKIYPDNPKLLFAANRMTSDNGKQNRSKNKMHGWLRRRLSEHMSEKMRIVNTGRKQSDEHIKKRADSRRGNAGALKGKKKPEEDRKKNPRSKKIMCVETGQIFYSARKAEELLGYNVRNAAAGFQKMAGGYTWIYVDNNCECSYENTKLPEKIKKRHTNCKKIKCIETGEIFDSVSDACKKYPNTDISRAARGAQKTSAGYHWQYI